MVTNLEYLIAVNAAAGRLLGDRSCHPVVPWVTDFSRKLGEVGSGGEPQEKGWRDLTITKFRLKKGDAQVRELLGFLNGRGCHWYACCLNLVLFLQRKAICDFCTGYGAAVVGPGLWHLAVDDDRLPF